MKKPVINIFDTFEDADDFTRRERLKMTPSELIELCYELSIATWELHYGELPKESLKNNPNISIRDLKE